MATKTIPRQRESDRPGSNGNSPTTSFNLSPPRAKVRLPELVVGIFVMGVFALGAVVWHLTAVDRTPALGLAVAVERGDTITASDVRVVYVDSDDPLAHLGEAQMNQIVGRVALVDLPAGTLLTTALVADPIALDAGEGVTGLSLEPGAYPAVGIAPGDRVNVVRAGDSGAGDASEAVIARNATVFAVQDLAGDRKLVSIMSSEADAEAIAAAAGGPLRLVMVAS